MLNCHAIAFFFVVSSSVVVLEANIGDVDPYYRSCVKECQEIGCFEERCFPNCKFSSNEAPINHPWNMLEPLYVQWKKWDCQNDCQYYCMLDKEKERVFHNEAPVKYHGKWPLKQIYGIQEPASMAFSTINFVIHLHGWMSFFTLLYNKLPLNASKKPYYKYASLWHGYGLLSLNAWFWSAIFHSRDFEIIEKLDYSSTVAFVGYSLILAILRSFNVNNDATKAMISGPLVSFVTTHILYLNFHDLDYGWNMMVFILIVVAQLIIWAIGGHINHHPSRWKLWSIGFIGGLSILVEIYDFPPYQGLVDANALCNAINIPLTYLWWSFIKDDAVFLTSKRVMRSKKSK